MPIIPSSSIGPAKASLSEQNLDIRPNTQVLSALEKLGTTGMEIASSMAMQKKRTESALYVNDSMVKYKTAAKQKQQELQSQLSETGDGKLQDGSDYTTEFSKWDNDYRQELLMSAPYDTARDTLSMSLNEQSMAESLEAEKFQYTLQQSAITESNKKRITFDAQDIQEFGTKYQAGQIGYYGLGRYRSLQEQNATLIETGSISPLRAKELNDAGLHEYATSVAESSIDNLDMQSFEDMFNVRFKKDEVTGKVTAEVPKHIYDTTPGEEKIFLSPMEISGEIKEVPETRILLQGLSADQHRTYIERMRDTIEREGKIRVSMLGTQTDNLAAALADKNGSSSLVQQTYKEHLINLLNTKQLPAYDAVNQASTLAIADFSRNSERLLAGKNLNQKKFYIDSQIGKDLIAKMANNASLIMDENRRNEYLKWIQDPRAQSNILAAYKNDLMRITAQQEKAKEEDPAKFVDENNLSKEYLQNKTLFAKTGNTKYLQRAYDAQYATQLRLGVAPHEVRLLRQDELADISNKINTLSKLNTEQALFAINDLKRVVRGTQYEPQITKEILDVYDNTKNSSNLDDGFKFLLLTDLDNKTSSEVLKLSANRKDIEDSSGKYLSLRKSVGSLPEAATIQTATFAKNANNTWIANTTLALVSQKAMTIKKENPEKSDVDAAKEAMAWAVGNNKKPGNIFSLFYNSNTGTTFAISQSTARNHGIDPNDKTYFERNEGKVLQYVARNYNIALVEQDRKALAYITKSNDNTAHNLTYFKTNSVHLAPIGTASVTVIDANGNEIMATDKNGNSKPIRFLLKDLNKITAGR